MIAFDVAAITFLLSCAPLFRHGPREMRRLAEMNDAHRGILLLIAAAVIGVIMTASASELSQKDRPRPGDVLLVILTLSAGCSAPWCTRYTTPICSTREVRKARTALAFTSRKQASLTIGTLSIFLLVWR